MSSSARQIGAIIAIVIVGAIAAVILISRTTAPPQPQITVAVFDQAGLPAPGIAVQVQTAPDGVGVWSGLTGDDGRTAQIPVEDGWRVQAGVAQESEPGVMLWSIPIVVDGDADLGRTTVVEQPCPVMPCNE